MEASEKRGFWDRIGVYVIIAGLFAGGAVLCVLLTQQLLSGNAPLTGLVAEAQNGDAQSQYLLGEAYLEGEYGLKKDLTQAKVWLRKAEAQHFVEAGCELATIRFNTLDDSITDAEAMAWFQEGVDAGDIDCMNNAAWFKSTLPDPALRDPQAAERIEKAVLLKQPNSPGYIDTLAAAYAAEGKFDEAVAAQQQAVDGERALSGDHRQGIAKMQARLQLYQQHQAYVESARDVPAAATRKP